MRCDVVAVVSVFDQRRLSAFVLRVGETWNEHASGQRIGAMRPNGAAGSLGEIIDCLGQLRLRRIGVDIEDENAAAFEAGQPKLTAVVGEPAVMRLITSIDGRAADDFAVGRRAGFYIDRNEFVRAIAHSFDAECPNIDELLLSIDTGEVRGGASLISVQNTRTEDQSAHERSSENCE